MIRGIHYFSTEFKTKIDVIPRGCFINSHIVSTCDHLDPDAGTAFRRQNLMSEDVRLITIPGLEE